MYFVCNKVLKEKIYSGCPVSPLAAQAAKGLTGQPQKNIIWRPMPPNTGPGYFYNPIIFADYPLPIANCTDHTGPLPV